MRYLIAYCPTDPEKEAVDILRKEIAATCNVHAALNLPPHITMFSPFETDAVRPLEATLVRLATTETPFVVPTTRFHSFREAVWYIDVAQTPELFHLKDIIRNAVEKTLGITETTEFKTHFHMTLAYQDVTQEAFRHIGTFLQNKKMPVDIFRINTVTLLKQSKPRHWETHRVFALQS